VVSVNFLEVIEEEVVMSNLLALKVLIIEHFAVFLTFRSTAIIIATIIEECAMILLNFV
jgi:hypothetical protein